MWHVAGCRWIFTFSFIITFFYMFLYEKTATSFYLLQNVLSQKVASQYSRMFNDVTTEMIE